jgi:hypothetical protein
MELVRIPARTVALALLAALLLALTAFAVLTGLPGLANSNAGNSWHTNDKSGVAGNSWHRAPATTILAGNSWH